MNKYPTTRYVFDRRKRSDNNTRKKGTVEVEICFQRKRKWISTGVAILPNQWSSTKFVINHPESGILNNRLMSVKKPIDIFINELMLADEPFSFEKLENKTRSESKYSGSFLLFVESTLDERTNIKESTRKQHKKLITALKEFKLISSFESVTRPNILAFNNWLGKKDISSQHSTSIIRPLNHMCTLQLLTI